MTTIYHNPRCMKSRQTLQLLKEHGVEPVVVEYLNDVPTATELKTLLQKLGISAEQLLRKKEAIFKEEFKGKTLTNDEWVDAMVCYPNLIERPIVVQGDQAMIGRPPEKVLTIL